MPHEVPRAREVLRRADRAGNDRLAAVAGRVVALAYGAQGQRVKALAAIGTAAEIAERGSCSNFDGRRIARSHAEMNRP